MIFLARLDSIRLVPMMMMDAMQAALLLGHAREPHEHQLASNASKFHCELLSHHTPVN